MNFRTDLALERKEYIDVHELDGIVCEEFERSGTKVSRIEVRDERGEKALEKPQGVYVTVEMEPFRGSFRVADKRMESVREELSRLLPKSGTVLVAGLGNTQITPDALGPKCLQSIFATRHLKRELTESIGLGSLRPVAGISTGVLGQTGVESGELIQGAVKVMKPSCVIAVDALAARRLSRLGCTVQIASSGIVPGSGVGNARAEISERTLGVPVISVGVPTVVDAATLAYDVLSRSSGKEIPGLREDLEPHGAGMMITPKEVDIMIERASKFLATAINCALQPTLSPEDILELTS